MKLPLSHNICLLTSKRQYTDSWMSNCRSEYCILLDCTDTHTTCVPAHHTHTHTHTHAHILCTPPHTTPPPPPPPTHTHTHTPKHTLTQPSLTQPQFHDALSAENADKANSKILQLQSHVATIQQHTMIGTDDHPHPDWSCD